MSVTCLNMKCFMYIVNIWKAHQEIVSNLIYTETLKSALPVIQNQLLKCFFNVWLQGRIYSHLCTFSRITLWFKPTLKIREKTLSDQGTKMGLKYLLTEIAIPQFMTRGVNYSKQFQSICF